MPASSPEIRQVVTQVYTSHTLLPPEWTPEQQREFVGQEAVRLSRQVAELAAELGEQAIQEWTARTGQHPDFLTKVGLMNTTTSQAQELVLGQQLYTLIPPPADDWLDDGSAARPDRAQAPWDQRWTSTYYRTDPSAELEDLAAAVWPSPDFTALFRIKASYLLAARAEDHQPLPIDRHDALADQLAQLVYADLRADGLPTEPTKL
ncbi:hypothetical protein ACXDF8_26135 [Mycolicibacterium sp. CBM1]